MVAFLDEGLFRKKFDEWIVTMIIRFEKFLVSHPWIGWVAFFILLALFLIFIAWQYLAKSRLKNRALSDIKNACEADSVMENLISASAVLSRKNLPVAEYHKICSDDESSGPNESLRSTPSYLYTGPNPRMSRVPISRRKDSYISQAPFEKPTNWKPGWPREALRQIYPSDISSVGSDSSRSYSRPLSYREMRRSGPSSPTLISPYSGF
jgi:hypothetical protein